MPIWSYHQIKNMHYVFLSKFSFFFIKIDFIKAIDKKIFWKKQIPFKTIFSIAFFFEKMHIAYLIYDQIGMYLNPNFSHLKNLHRSAQPKMQFFLFQLSISA